MNSWLNGYEYAFILRHYRAYIQCYPDTILLSKLSHPSIIYEKPKGKIYFLHLFLAGQIYFIRGWHLREFGFPRDQEVKKKFKWKKMNFTTDLPKNNPLCTYLVASAKQDKELLRMHVVSLA